MLEVARPARVKDVSSTKEGVPPVAACFADERVERCRNASRLPSAALTFGPNRDALTDPPPERDRAARSGPLKP